ncbi:hypothetical protein EV426DRAFT_668289 [Tirmania nivea]|nr:hypothetical protein EV426DRAFT_668289 [Tirmania nivea]
MDATDNAPIRTESGTMNGESRYALHPSSIKHDQRLRTCEGKGDHHSDAKESLEVLGKAYARTTGKGVRSTTCFVQLTAGDEVLLDIDDLRVISYDAAVPQTPDVAIDQPCWQSCWVQLEMDEESQEKRAGVSDLLIVYRGASPPSAIVQILTLEPAHGYYMRSVCLSVYSEEYGRQARGCNGTLVLGLKRSLVAEQASLDLKIIDTDVLDDASLTHIISQVTERANDTEFLIRDGIIHVNRLHPHSAVNSVHEALSQARPDLHGAKAQWNGLRMLTGKVDHTNFNRAFSGVVTAVADDARSLQVGDSVCGICVDQYSTYQVVLEGLCQKIDAHIQEDFENVASMPVGYTTAHHALSSLARLQEDETILITAATGFAGQVAIALAQFMKAKICPQMSEAIFDKDSSYLLVGCLGGLGRRDDKAEAARLIADIQRQGCTATVIWGDVAVKEDVLRALANAPTPIRGIVQPATVFGGALFETLDASGLERSFKAKFHLSNFWASWTNELRSGQQLPRHMARHRQTLGLPATSLVLPMLLGVGYVSERPEIEQGLTRKGLCGIDEGELLRSFEIAVRGWKGEQPEMIIGMDPSRLSKVLQKSSTADLFWFNDPRLSNIKESIQALNSRIEFGKSNREGLIDTATEYIKEKLARIMLIDLYEISVSKSVSYYGVDSSVRTELRNWLFNEFKERSRRDMEDLFFLGSQVKAW